MTTLCLYLWEGCSVDWKEHSGFLLTHQFSSPSVSPSQFSYVDADGNPVLVTQLTFLRLLSAVARQNFTLFCQNMAAWYEADTHSHMKALHFRAFNDVELMHNSTDTPIHALYDGCQVREHSSTFFLSLDYSSIPWSSSPQHEMTLWIAAHSDYIWTLKWRSWSMRSPSHRWNFEYSKIIMKENHLLQKPFQWLFPFHSSFSFFLSIFQLSYEP